MSLFAMDQQAFDAAVGAAYDPYDTYAAVGYPMSISQGYSSPFVTNTIFLVMTVEGCSAEQVIRMKDPFVCVATNTGTLELTSHHLEPVLL